MINLLKNFLRKGKITDFSYISLDKKNCDELIKGYQKQKPEIQAQIKESGLLPNIPKKKLDREAKKNLSEVKSIINSHKKFESFKSKFDDNYSDGFVLGQLTDTENFYKFSLSSTITQKKLMKHPNETPAGVLEDESNYKLSYWTRRYSEEHSKPSEIFIISENSR